MVSGPVGMRGVIVAVVVAVCQPVDLLTRFPEVWEKLTDWVRGLSQKSGSLPLCYIPVPFRWSCAFFNFGVLQYYLNFN